jgi:hypothetical protein
MPRAGSRVTYLVLALATIGIGLAVHRGVGGLSPRARDVLGDALWAMMIMWWIGAIAPAARLPIRSIVALAICFAVESSQYFHAPALDALRGTAIGQLVLGTGFDARDLAAYALGVLAAALLEGAAIRRLPTPPK